MIDTLDLHLDRDGMLTLERSLLHEAILKDLFDGCSPAPQSSVVFMAGGPASGKTTLAKSLGLTPGTVVISVDDIRERLPEYPRWRDEGRRDAAELTHREASQIAKRALGIAIDRGVDVVLDGVGGEGFAQKIGAVLRRGARCRVCYATVSVALALRREQKRFRATGRGVPAAVLRAKHAEVSRELDNVMQLKVDLIEIYDTSDMEPHLLARGPGGKGREALKVVDPDGYAAFLAKGDS